MLQHKKGGDLSLCNVGSNVPENPVIYFFSVTSHRPCSRSLASMLFAKISIPMYHGPADEL
jgi:hypothetical protein